MTPNNGGFGKRGVDQSKTGTHQIAPNSNVNALQRQKSPHTIYREGEAERPAFHDSFLERHWPKFGAVAFALFAVGYAASQFKITADQLILMPLIAGAVAYLFLNGIRKSLNDVHTARTEIFRSPRFAVGALVGLAYFMYSVVFAAPASSGNEIADAVAQFQDPMMPFRDGIQRADLPALGLLLGKAAAYMAGGGLLVRMIAGRLMGPEEA